MVTFPTVASTFNYMQAGDAYFFCLLLTCLAVCLVCGTSKFGWFAAAVLLTLSMGIYQSYLAFAVALLVIWHIKGLLIEDKDINDVLLSGIKSISIIGISVAAYWIITKLVLKQYGGEFIGHISVFVLDDFSVKNVCQRALKACKESLCFYLTNGYGVHYSIMSYLYILVLLVAVVFSFILFKRFDRKKSKMKILLLLCLYAALPLASGLIYCMCAKVHMLMVYGFVALALFPIILADQVENSNLAIEGIRGKLIHFGQIAIILTVFITSFDYAMVSNKAYLTLYLTYEQSYAYSNRLMTEIQMQPDFEKGDTIVLIGWPAVNINYTMPWREEEDVHALRGVTESLTNVYSFGKYLKFYLGVEQEVIQITSLDEWKDFETDIDISELSCYPNSGSIICEENTIFVKFGDVN